MHVSRSTEHKTPWVKPHVNYGVWVIITCQSRFTSCNKCVTSGAECWYWARPSDRGGRKYGGNSLYYLLSCARNLKLFLKKKFISKENNEIYWQREKSKNMVLFVNYIKFVLVEQSNVSYSLFAVLQINSWETGKTTTAMWKMPW